jgi:hypothetical protein
VAVYTFKPVPVFGEAGRFVRLGGASGATYPVTDPSGNPVTVNETGLTYVTADANGILPEFHTTDVPTVLIQMTPGITVKSDSVEAVAGSASYAAAAASSATDAANSATDAANSAAAASGKVDKGTLMYYAGDYASPQACLDAAPPGATVKLDSATITTPLSITKAVSIVGGGQRNTIITANGCDGFVVAAGVGDVTIQRLAVKQSTRYTTAANTYVGIKIQGDSVNRPSVHTYRDVYLDGFETGIQSNYLWTSRFDNVQTAFGLYGLDVYGLSENNTVTGCNLVVGVGSQTRLTNSTSIRLNGQVSRTDSTALVSEGWVVSDTLMYGGDFGVDARGYGNYQVANCIIDAVQQAGVRVINNGTAYGGNCLIQGNYIAFAGNANTTLGAVDIANTVAGMRAARVFDNEIITYAGAVAPYGVRVIASTGAQANIRGNTINGFGTYDISVSSTGSQVTGNRCLSSGLTYNIFSASGQHNLVSDNIGAVYVAGGTLPNTYSMVGGVKVAPAVAAPTSTAIAWNKGDRVINYNATVGQPKAWVCTVAGSPGTWVSEGNL